MSPNRPERLAVLADLDKPVIAIVATDEAARLAWSHGARGVLPRSVGRAGLGAAIRAVAEGLKIIDARLAGTVASPAVSEPLRPAEDLTPRRTADPSIGGRGVFE